MSQIEADAQASEWYVQTHSRQRTSSVSIVTLAVLSAQVPGMLMYWCTAMSAEHDRPAMDAATDLPFGHCIRRANRGQEHENGIFKLA